jgi:hypothetical protein
MRRHLLGALRSVRTGRALGRRETPSAVTRNTLTPLLIRRLHGSEEGEVTDSPELRAPLIQINTFKKDASLDAAWVI